MSELSREGVSNLIHSFEPDEAEVYGLTHDEGSVVFTNAEWYGNIDKAIECLDALKDREDVQVDIRIGAVFFAEDEEVA